MSFVERVNSLADARGVLGVGPQASIDDIRGAWKRVAFRTHPDRNGGRRADFDRAGAAYALLLGETKAAAPDAEPAQAELRRPRAEARAERLSDEAVAACARLLDQPARFPGAAPRPDFVHLEQDTAEAPVADHVPMAVERRGRDMVFVVAAALGEGVNRVAIPSAEFLDRRKIVPRIVVFRAPRSGAGVVVIPDEVLQKVVPGARSVKIRFTGGDEVDGSQHAA